VVWLLTPAPSGEPRPGRPVLFRLLALLLPGSALLDGAWGAVLLLGWAAALSSWLAGRGWLEVPYLPGPVSPSLLLIILAAVYALNTVGLSLQEIGWLRTRRAAGQARRRDN